jgi:hypothetical protein
MSEPARTFFLAFVVGMVLSPPIPDIPYDDESVYTAVPCEFAIPIEGRQTEL